MLEAVVEQSHPAFHSFRPLELRVGDGGVDDVLQSVWRDLPPVFHEIVFGRVQRQVLVLKKVWGENISLGLSNTHVT